MTKVRYRWLMKKAIRDSIEKRWRPLVDGESILLVIPCPICVLGNKNFSGTEKRCNACPVYDGSDVCCKEWYEYCTGETPKIQMEAAYKMIERLEAIDVDAWTEKLSKMGVFDE